MRYAGYVRISSEEQVGNFSVDAQRRAIEAWVAAKGGKLVKVWRKVKVAGHAEEVLAAVKALK